MAAARRAQVDQALASQGDRIERLERTVQRHETSIRTAHRSTTMVGEVFSKSDASYISKKAE